MREWNLLVKEEAEDTKISNFLHTHRLRNSLVAMIAMAVNKRQVLYI